MEILWRKANVILGNFEWLKIMAFVLHSVLWKHWHIAIVLCWISQSIAFYLVKNCHANAVSVVNCGSYISCSCLSNWWWKCSENISLAQVINFFFCNRQQVPRGVSTPAGGLVLLQKGSKHLIESWLGQSNNVNVSHTQQTICCSSLFDAAQMQMAVACLG